MKDVNIFLKEHKIRSADIDLQKLVDVITLDMEGGLKGLKALFA